MQPCDEGQTSLLTSGGRISEAGSKWRTSACVCVYHIFKKSWHLLKPNLAHFMFSAHLWHPPSHQLPYAHLQYSLFLQSFLRYGPVQQANWGNVAHTHLSVYICTETKLIHDFFPLPKSWPRLINFTNWGYKLEVRRFRVLLVCKFCWSSMVWESVGLIGGEQCCVHRLHAGGAGEGPHQPVIYTVHVIDMHARQEPDGVPIHKVHHADDTPAEMNTEVSSSQYGYLTEILVTSSSSWYSCSLIQ